MSNKELSKFKDFLVRETNDSLRELEKIERDSDFPIIKRGVQDLLRMLMISVAPKRILELGCGVGFSSILMAMYNKNLEIITTLELKEPNIKRAKKNIKDFGFEDKIKIVHADACVALNEKNELLPEYDLIFIDCAKGQYVNLWEDVRGFVRPGGIIITDDILQNDTLLGSRFLLNRRDRTIHKRMREFLHKQLNDPDFTGAIFEIDDGVSILTRNTDE